MPAVEWKHNYAEKKGLRLRTGSMHLPREGMPVKFKDPSGKVTQLQVKPWQTIKEVKRLLAEATAPTGVPALLVALGFFLSHWFVQDSSS